MVTWLLKLRGGDMGDGKDVKKNSGLHSELDG